MGITLAINLQLLEAMKKKAELRANLLLIIIYTLSQDLLH